MKSLLQTKEQKIKLLETVLILAAIWVVAFIIIFGLDNAKLIVIPAILASGCTLFAWASPKKWAQVKDFLFRYRWAVAGFVFLVCLIFRFSGSSIGFFNDIFTEQIVTQKSTLFGIARSIRSDEYGVQTLQHFSQYYNDFNLYSTRLSYTPTNMVVDYFSPVWDLTIIGKPLLWGYLLFGNEVGLSFHWCSLVILLFMCGLEMTYILTRKNRMASFLGGTFVLFSPAIQWWILPHIPIVVLYAMALFVVGYYFFMAKKTWAKWGFAALAVISVCGFALSIFPAFQVPCAYAVLVLLIVCLVRDREAFSFKKPDVLRVILVALISLGILAYFVWVSKDDILALLHTDYPGDRVCTGGEYTWRDLFTDISSVFLPYCCITFLNQCEASTYIQFAPLFAFLMIRFLKPLKERDKKELYVGIALLSLLIAAAFFMCIGIPEWLAKITFLKYCNRMRFIYGWLAAFFTCWGIYICFKYPDLLKTWEKILYPILYGVICILHINENTAGYFASFPEMFGISIGPFMLLGSIALMIVLVALMLWRNKKLLVAFALLTMFFVGGTVNPVEQGISAITNHPISEEVSKIVSENPEEKWLTTDCGHVIANFLLANGAKVMDATNFYPDTEKWEMIDPENLYQFETNRYANQIFYIWDEDYNKVEVISPDLIYVTIQPEVLKELGIRYLCTRKDYTALLNAKGISTDFIAGQGEYFIFELSY